MTDLQLAMTLFLRRICLGLSLPASFPDSTVPAVTAGTVGKEVLASSDIILWAALRQTHSIKARVTSWRISSRLPSMSSVR